MITVTLQGGLGNQMFQYALGAALAKRGRDVQYFPHNLALGYAERAHDRRKPDYGLDGFSIGPVLFSMPNEPMFRGDTVGYNPGVWYFEQGTLSGYWQSERYFEGIEDHLFLAFQPRVDSIAPRAADVISKIMTAEGCSVGLQVRRGDYLQFKDFHGVMGKDYFREGAVVARNFLPLTYKQSLFVWTDDEEWCRENIPDAYIANTGSRHWDIHAMSLCTSLVISNSTFGWWGAWLGDKHKFPGRRVVAPAKWFQTDTVNGNDIVPDRWVKI